MSKPSPPPAPDFTGAAKEQGQQNLQAAQTQTQLNRPNQNTPWGSQTWSQDPNNPNQYTSNITLDPAQQSLLNSSNQISQGLADVGQQNLGRVGQAQAQPFDTSQYAPLAGAPSVGKIPGTDDFSADRRRYEDAIMSRNNTDFDRQQESLNQTLANQGVTPGSDAYNRAYDQFNRAKVDARNQATLAGGQEQSRMFGLGSQAEAQRFGEQMGANQFGNQARQQGIQEQSYLRQLPLNELNALRTGSQVNAPQFTQYNNAGNVMPPPTFPAAQAQYGAANGLYGQNTGMYNNTIGGLFNLGSSLAGMFGG